MRFPESDPGDEQTTLFAPATVEPKRCSRGCRHKNLCEWIADRENDGIHATQPRTCLLRYDQLNAQIPF